MDGLLLFIFHILNDVRYVTVQNKTKRIQCFQGYGFSMFHPVQRVGGKDFLVDQVILSYAALLKSLVKRLVVEAVENE